MHVLLDQTWRKVMWQLTHIWTYLRWHTFLNQDWIYFKSTLNQPWGPSWIMATCIGRGPDIWRRWFNIQYADPTYKLFICSEFSQGPPDFKLAWINAAIHRTEGFLTGLIDSGTGGIRNGKTIVGIEARQRLPPLSGQSDLDMCNEPANQ